MSNKEKQLTDEQIANRKNAQKKYRTSHKTLNFRLEEKDAVILKKRIKASGMTAQSFYYRAIFDKPLIDKESLKNLFMELKKEGVNLNQIAHKLNSDREVDYSEIFKAIKALQEKQEDLWQFLRQ